MSDLVIVGRKQMGIFRVAIPGNTWLKEKEFEKIGKRKHLQSEMKPLWQKEANLVTGALGAIAKDPENIFLLCV